MAVESRIIKREDSHYRLIKYYTKHTGTVSIKVTAGQRLEEGDLLYTITRLDLIKKILCDYNEGIVKKINRPVDNGFCGYNTFILELELKLTPEEEQTLEEETHYKFVTSPQGAQYFVTPNPGLPPLVSVGDIIEKGRVLAIAMVMKKRREIVYEGSRGRVARIYFLNGQQVTEGEKLFGIVPKPI
jgi:acetyl/propionyl-CoA carboxylase alpha subunit